MRLAFLIPNITGKEFNPNFESPSTLLKSFITAIPSPERLYARVNNAVIIVNLPNKACPAHHGRAMYEAPKA